MWAELIQPEQANQAWEQQNILALGKMDHTYSGTLFRSDILKCNEPLYCCWVLWKLVYDTVQNKIFNYTTSFPLLSDSSINNYVKEKNVVGFH